MRVLKSFVFAFQGLKDALQHEKNFQVECVMALLAGIAGFYFSLSPSEWCLLLLCSGLVLGTEIMNSAIEKLCNRVTMQKDPLIKKIKDLSAAAVLITAAFSFTIGCIIFLPKIKMLF